MSEPTYIPDDLMDVKPEEDMLTRISIGQADGVKCPRCWKLHSVRVNFDNLCDRCQQTILSDHPAHESVPHIQTALVEQRKRWGL